MMGFLIPGSVRGQVGQGLEQPGRAESVPAHGMRWEPDELSGSFLPKPFPDSLIPAPTWMHPHPAESPPCAHPSGLFLQTFKPAHLSAHPEMFLAPHHSLTHGWILPSRLWSCCALSPSQAVQIGSSSRGCCCLELLLSLQWH